MSSSSMLPEIKGRVKAMRTINEKQEKRLRHIETKVTQQVILYILFQVLTLLSICKPSSISCAQWYIPFSLSALVGIIFFLAFASTTNKWDRTKFEYERNLIEESLLFYQMILAQQSQIKAEEGSSERHPDVLLQQQQIFKPEMLKVYQRRAYIYVTAFALFFYTGVILHACRSIPCDATAPTKS